MSTPPLQPKKFQRHDQDEGELPCVQPDICLVFVLSRFFVSCLFYLYLLAPLARLHYENGRWVRSGLCFLVLISFVIPVLICVSRLYYRQVTIFLLFETVPFTASHLPSPSLQTPKTCKQWPIWLRFFFFSSRLRRVLLMHMFHSSGHCLCTASRTLPCYPDCR
jgi:hypothetical protein